MRTLDKDSFFCYNNIKKVNYEKIYSIYYIWYKSFNG